MLCRYSTCAGVLGQSIAHMLGMYCYGFLLWVVFWECGLHFLSEQMYMNGTSLTTQHSMPQHNTAQRSKHNAIQNSPALMYTTYTN